ncbi:MAG: RICIN domain-containing protein [Ruminococcus sp.]|nr:RICIN domain-containing protein [Ruminococcus sp.]
MEFRWGIAAFSIGNGYGQDASSHNWSPFKSGNVVSVFCDGKKNQNKNCFYEERSVTFPYMYIKAGRYVDPPRTGKLPYEFNFNGMSNVPTDYPEWDFVCKKSIKNVHSQRYISPGSGNTVVQKNSVNGAAYKWRINFAENGYFYILLEDTNIAITVSSLVCGEDLLLQPLRIGSNKQKWKFEGNSTNGFYIVPRLSETMTMEVENASYLDDAPIQLWNQVSTAPQMRWQIV